MSCIIENRLCTSGLLLSRFFEHFIIFLRFLQLYIFWILQTWINKYNYKCLLLIELVNLLKTAASSIQPSNAVHLRYKNSGLFQFPLGEGDCQDQVSPNCISLFMVKLECRRFCDHRLDNM